MESLVKYVDQKIEAVKEPDFIEDRIERAVSVIRLIVEKLGYKNQSDAERGIEAVRSLKDFNSSSISFGVYDADKVSYITSKQNVGEGGKRFSMQTFSDNVDVPYAATVTIRVKNHSMRPDFIPIKDVDTVKDIILSFVTILASHRETLELEDQISDEDTKVFTTQAQ